MSQNLTDEVVPILCTTYLGGAERDLGQVQVGGGWSKSRSRHLRIRMSQQVKPWVEMGGGLQVAGETNGKEKGCDTVCKQERTNKTG